jgi:hypothetical protein
MQLHLSFPVVLLVCAVAYIGLHYLFTRNKYKPAIPDYVSTKPSAKVSLADTESDLVWRVASRLCDIYEEAKCYRKTIRVNRIEKLVGEYLQELHRRPEFGTFADPKVTSRIVDNDTIKFLIVGARYGIHTEVAFPYGKYIK